MTSLRRVTAGLLTVAALAFPLATTPTTADASAKYHYKNCTKLHKDFKHGVGKKGAKDHHTSGKAVTNFKHSTKIYKAAIKYNSRLDADHDGIACEKH